jgi:sec-independent protein translocase protein TatA
MPLASLFDLEAPDIIVILVIVLLLFGFRKLPDLARGLGEALRQFRKTAEDAGDSDDEFDRAPGPLNLFNVFASFLVFLALTVFIMTLASRLPH